jgi:hypothetical protein
MGSGPKALPIDENGHVIVAMCKAWSPLPNVIEWIRDSFGYHHDKYDNAHLLKDAAVSRNMLAVVFVSSARSSSEVSGQKNGTYFE